MMIRNARYLSMTVISFLFLAVLIPSLIFINRRPVLVISDNTTISLYGQKRTEKKAAAAAFKLFRPVRTVSVTDESGDDILLAAISAASNRPFCVLFPESYAAAAHIYREQNEDIPVIILLARRLPDEIPASFFINNSDFNHYFIYSNDLATDFYLIGQAITAINGEKNGRAAVFTNFSIIKPAQEAVNQAFTDAGVDIQCSFYSSYSQFASSTDLSCVVLAGTGYEYFEKQSDVPVICCGWLDTDLLPLEVKINIDDSPWAQVEDAVTLFLAGNKKGLISSKVELINTKYTDNDIVIKLREILKLNIKKDKKK